MYYECSKKEQFKKYNCKTKDMKEFECNCTFVIETPTKKQMTIQSNPQYCNILKSGH